MHFEHAMPQTEEALLLRRSQLTKGIAIETSIAQMTTYLRHYFAQKEVVHQCDAAVVMGLLANDIEADTHRMEITMKRRVIGGTARPADTVRLSSEADQLAELRRIQQEVEVERSGLIQALQERTSLARQLAELSSCM